MWVTTLSTTSFPPRLLGYAQPTFGDGPWGYLWANDSTVRDRADWRIDSLDQLREVLPIPGLT